MNILIVEDAASSTFGGAERTMRSYCEYLAKDHRLHLIYDRVGDYACDKSNIYATINRISLHPFRAQPTLSWFREMFRLVFLCKKEKIDLILTHVVHSVSMLRVVRILTGIRVVMLFKWVCSTDRVGLQAEWGLRGLDCGISVSRFVADYWTRNGFPPHKMRVIPEGVRVDAEESRTETEGLRSPIPTSHLAVGFAGRIVPEKGLHVLIDALAHLRSSGKEAECFVAGTFEPDADSSSYPYHAALRKRVHDLNMECKVHFLGYVTPLSDFLKQMDVVVVPSLCQEAQPIVLLESMAVGTPVVASEVGGVPEMMTGPLVKWVFRPNDAGEICSKLGEFETLTNSEKHQLSRTLKAHAMTHYSIEQCHQRLTEVIVCGTN